MTNKHETATFASGCFWCTEAVFKRLRGVQSVMSGYTGGTKPNPTYDDVCSGSTGHAEAVQVEFDPAVISYERLVEVFFGTHDPTQLNGQGNDIGAQYRSVIFTHSDEQQKTAEAVRNRLEQDKVFDDPIVTDIRPAAEFYPAEEYHRDYYAQNPNQAYCRAVINPKLAKLRQKYTAYLKAQ